MLYSDNIKVEFESQGFRCTHLGISPETDKTVLFYESLRKTVLHGNLLRKVNRKTIKK